MPACGKEFRLNWFNWLRRKAMPTCRRNSASSPFSAATKREDLEFAGGLGGGRKRQRQKPQFRQAVAAAVAPAANTLLSPEPAVALAVPVFIQPFARSPRFQGAGSSQFSDSCAKALGERGFSVATCERDGARRIGDDKRRAARALGGATANPAI